MINQFEALDSFKSAMLAAIGAAPERIDTSGKLTRFSTSGKPQDKAGYYGLFLHPVAAGFFGCFRSGVYRTWVHKSREHTDPKEWHAIQRKLAVMREQNRQEQAATRQAKTETQRRVWALAGQADPQHVYLSRKRVDAFGLRQQGNTLLVPLRDIAGTLQGLQHIKPDGEKRIHGTMKGNFHHTSRLATPTGTLYIAEGYATGATIHQITGQPVIIAFSAGNLSPVGLLVRRKYPEADIVFAADNDIGSVCNGIENPGIHYARQAAKACYGRVIIPNTEHKADFNDLLAEVAA